MMFDGSGFVSQVWRIASLTQPISLRLFIHVSFEEATKLVPDSVGHSQIDPWIYKYLKKIPNSIKKKFKKIPNSIKLSSWSHN
jgi:hypothetical protein